MFVICCSEIAFRRIVIEPIDFVPKRLSENVSTNALTDWSDFSC